MSKKATEFQRKAMSRMYRGKEMPALCNVDFAAMELLHARLVRTTTCVDGCQCDYTICGDQDPYAKEHPEYRDENGYRRNRE